MQYFKYLIALIFPLSLFSQGFTNQWTGHYSYFKVNELYSVDNKVYAASENSIFVYDIDTETSEIFSTIHGLSGESISAIYHSEAYDITLIGYNNGQVELIIDNEVRTFVDIVDKPTIPPTQKTINGFFEDQGIVYIYTKFGIVEFNLDRIEFGDTFFIGPGGSQINITGVVVFDGTIYASTFFDRGLLSAPVDSPNLVDFNQWVTATTGNFNGVTVFNDQLLVWQDSNLIRRFENGTLATVITSPLIIKAINSNSDNLTLTVVEGSIVYGANLQEVTSLISTVENSFMANSSLTLNNSLYIATKEKGLLELDVSNIDVKKSISPDGPLFNRVFRVEASNNNLWTIFGEYDINYNPFPFPDRNRGISKLTPDGWFHISKNEVFEATGLSHITINPANEDQVFVSSLNDGLLEINNNVVTNQYSKNNSGFQSFDPSVIEEDLVFLNGSVFDNKGNLWVTNGRIDNGLKRFTPETNEVSNVNLSSVISTLTRNLGFSDTVLDRNGNVFFGTYSFGFIGYNPNTGGLIKFQGKNEGSNLPSDNVLALEVDRNNQLWIGTFRGVRILFNPAGAFQQTNPQVNQIIITDDEGVPQELLFDQTITDIEADGSNNKWVATASSGVFYFSPDGRETLLHLTKDNSPLPTNNVLDISIDDSTGSVYFATLQGLLEYKGTATGPENNLKNVVAFPNPVRPGYSGSITIKGLTSRANVKITDVEGNLVYEKVSEGGSIQWDTTAFGKHKVASGVYFILITGDDAVETTVSKLLIVR